MMAINLKYNDDPETQRLSNPPVSLDFPWATRLQQVIAKYRPSASEASFKKACCEILERTPEDRRALLTSIPAIIVEWSSKVPPKPQEAQQQWNEFYKAGRDRLPTALLKTVLQSFPKTISGELSWDAFILTCVDCTLLRVLLKRKLVRLKDLQRLAKDQPRAFYQSAALDVLITQGRLRSGAAIFEICCVQNDRPSGLLRQEQIAVACYSSMRGKRGDEQMCSYLLGAADGAERIFGAILDHQAEAIRLCRYLMVKLIRSKNTKSNSRCVDIAALLITWIRKCDSELALHSSPRRMTASLVVSTLQLALCAVAPASPESAIAELQGVAEVVVETLILGTLREQDDRLPSPATIVVQSSTLHQIVRRYLSQLHDHVEEIDQIEDATVRHQIYQSRKLIIEQILAILNESDSEQYLRDGLNSVLFNSGVRSIGDTGEEVEFSFRQHESASPGIVDGDAVRIVRPGKRLGDEQDGVILLRAKVNPVINVGKEK